MISDDSMVQLITQALLVTLKIATPVLLSGIVIGLAISIFQSVTQINEQTLSLVPKIIAMVTVTIFLMHWIWKRLAEFAIEMFTLIP